MATRSNTITLEPNVPVDITLKYQTGRPISNGNVMFSTTTNEVLFVKPEDAEKIHGLGLGINEPLRIMRRIVDGEKSILVSRIPKSVEQPVSRPAAPATAPAAATCSESPVDQPRKDDTSLSRRLAACYIVAIDALQIAADYAKAKGLTLRITEEEIRAAAHCTFIEAGRAQERDLREREFTCRYGWQNTAEHVNGGDRRWPQQ